MIFDAGLYREQLQEIYELFRSYTQHQALDDYINVDHEYYLKNSDRRKVLEKYIFEAKKTIIGDNQKNRHSNLEVSDHTDTNDIILIIFGLNKLII